MVDIEDSSWILGSCALPGRQVVIAWRVDGSALWAIWSEHGLVRKPARLGIQAEQL